MICYLEEGALHFTTTSDRWNRINLQRKSHDQQQSCDNFIKNEDYGERQLEQITLKTEKYIGK